VPVRVTADHHRAQRPRQKRRTVRAPRQQQRHEFAAGEKRGANLRREIAVNGEIKKL
jgi:hypothetical protein